MIPVLGVPVLNRPDLLSRLLTSIDYPVETVAVIDNSCGNPDIRAVLRQAAASLPIRTMTPFNNMGVGWSWNHIVKSFPHAPWWLICGSDIEFATGDLAKIAETAFSTESVADASLAILHAHASNAFALFADAIHNVGLFDENLFPAYLEDCDYHRRVDLAHMVRRDIPGLGIRHGDDLLDGSCTVNSDPVLQRENSRTHGQNFGYYRAKWGGDNGQELYVCPFNRVGHRMPLDYQPFDLERRKGQVWRP